MPLDDLGCTRATLMCSTSVSPLPEGEGNLRKAHRDGDRLLQLLIFNEECLVNACHQHALITSLPFVHTARRTYRSNDPVKTLDSLLVWVSAHRKEEKLFKRYHLEEGEVVTRFP